MPFSRHHAPTSSLSAEVGRALIAIALIFATMLAPFSPSVAIAQETPVQPAAADVILVPLEDVAGVTVGDSHGCALTTAGAVWCWGSNSQGQLANHTNLQIATYAIDALELESGVTAIAAGDKFNCALIEDGTVKCWGDDDSGQLGNGDGFVTFLPVAVNGLSGVTVISAHGSTACAIAAGGVLMCWGENGDGQLGDGTQDDRTEPVAVTFPAPTVATKVSVGTSHVCAITSAGALYCWGANGSGQIGDNSTAMRLLPVAVSGMGSDVSAVGTGAAHTCAVVVGVLNCWGESDHGQIGDSTIMDDRLTPVEVGGSLDVVEIALGDDHSCARTAEGSAYCWGSDVLSQLGDANVGTVKAAPEPVDGSDAGVTAIAAGTDTSCSVRSTGRATCWGRSNIFSVGNPDYPEFAETPVFVMTADVCYALNLSGGPFGSPPTASPEFGAECDANTYRKGDVITITAHPGYMNQVLSWSGVNPADNVRGNNTAVITMPAANHDVNVVYEICHSLNVTTIGRDAPVIAEPYFPACGAFGYPADVVVTLNAAPDLHERVVSWTGVDGAPALGETVVTLTMPFDDRDVTVTYERCYHLATNEVENGENILRTPLGSDGCGKGYFVEGANVTLTADPDADFAVLRWTGTDGAPDWGKTTATVTMQASDKSVGVDYEPCLPLTISKTGNGSLPLASPASWNQCAAGEFAQYALIDLTAAPASGWHVESWTGANQDGDSITNQVTVFGVDKTVIVNYAEGEATPTPSERVYLPNVRK